MASQLDIQENARQTRKAGNASNPSGGQLRDWEIEQLNQSQQAPEDLWQPTPVNLEAELGQKQEAEEARMQELEEQKQIDRVAAQQASEQAKQNSAVNQAQRLAAVWRQSPPVQIDRLAHHCLRGVLAFSCTSYDQNANKLRVSI